MLNKLLIEGRLTLIAAFLAQMSRLGSIPKDHFLKDKDMVAASESYLRRALEAIFDIGRHIAAKKGGTDLATEYKSIAKFLGDKGIISEGLSISLIEMAGYRNRLVHLYHLINDEELYDILQNDLSDIKRFISEIKSYIEINE